MTLTKITSKVGYPSAREKHDYARFRLRDRFVRVAVDPSNFRKPRDQEQILSRSDQNWQVRYFSHGVRNSFLYLDSNGEGRGKKKKKRLYILYLRTRVIGTKLCKTRWWWYNCVVRARF